MKKKHQLDFSIHDLGLVIPHDEVIAISDSGCDQCILNIKAFNVYSFTGRYFNIGPALNSMSLDNCLEVVDDAYTTMIFEGGVKVIGVFNQGLLDSATPTSLVRSYL